MNLDRLSIVSDLALLGLSVIFGVIITIAAVSNKKYETELHERAIQQEQLQIKLNSVKISIVDEIESYLYMVAPTNKINAEIFFNLCDRYNVDVRFVLAQGQVESHFATKGTASKTNSIFNVGAYDGHSAKRQMRNGFGYKDPNDSIEPYLILLTNNYLIGGKTINDLMCNYVNHLGMRYASNKRYERMIRNVYNRINNNTNLDILIAEYNEYKKLLC